MSDAISRFLQAQREAGVEFHSLTVVREGEPLVALAAEPWGLEQQSLIYSMSKTFTSAAFGIAWDEGKLSPDDLLVDLFSDLVDDRVGPKARTIRLRDCLAMASGHTTDTITLFQGRWDVGPEGLGDFLRWEPEGEVGVTFCYNQLCTYAVSVAISKAMGKTVHELIRERVLDPMGAGPTYWSTDSAGNSAGYSGMHIAPRDLAKFIGLLTNDGVYQGERLLPQRWIEEYPIRKVATTDDPGAPEWTNGYGWQVWRNREGHRADGACGQYGLMWPEEKLAVVITSSTDSMQETIDQVFDILLPEIDQLQVPDEPVVVPPALGAIAEPGQVWEGTDERGGRLSLTAVENGWELLWDDADGGQHRLGVGHGHWVEGSMTWSHEQYGERIAKVACSAAVQDDDAIEVRIACIQTPHTAMLRLTDQARMTWTTQPLGRDTIAAISLPAGWDE
ncbi:serine hydrolase domain-containing protein [Aestuariimicrobium ganziense]|uniref:serine hydrolase domain-containing protein n=1 Tax=Aestuariimicrobium ganziense TaxID=2773677 RepID=UPI001940877D|nr:serine hydrolase [Aestuariimicrobium ganziense]